MKNWFLEQRSIKIEIGCKQQEMKKLYFKKLCRDYEIIFHEFYHEILLPHDECFRRDDLIAISIYIYDQL